MLAFACSLFGIAGSGYQIVYLGFLLLILGIPIYWIVAWNKQRAAAGEPVIEVRIALNTGCCSKQGDTR